jgi:predicted aspartyl protease/cytochrome c-type biogenesis protein CcmH/NrfG
MVHKCFLLVGFQLPFLAQRLIILSLVCLMCFSSNVSAVDDRQQTVASDTRRLIKQAKKLKDKGEFAEAEKVLRRVIEVNPQEAEAKLNLAYVLVKQRQLLEAYNITIEVAEADPKNSYAFAVLGTALLTAGNFRDSRISLVNALRINKRESLAWASLGTLDFYENRIFDGLENLRTAVYFEPDDADFIFTLAQIASRSEQYKEAAAAYERFLQISPLTDSDRRDRIKGLIKFLRFLGDKQSLYSTQNEGQTSISFRLINDRPVFKIKINKTEEPMNFVLDTGSGISVISDETAQRLKIKAVSRGGSARAIGGNGKFDIVYGFLQSVYIGDVKIRNVPVYIRKFHSNGERIDGYIGLSLISKFLTTLDYGNSTFSLKRKDLEANKRRENDNLSLPLRLTSSGFLSGEVQLEGIETPLNFIVDTGASISVISDALAGTKEISRFLKDERMRVIGAAGVTENVPTFLLPRVTFGTHSRERIKAISLDLNLINEASGFEQAGILGGNFLKNYRLTFDFENSKVIFVPIK